MNLTWERRRLAGVNVEAFHEPHEFRSLSLKAAEDRRTPRHWRVGHSRAHFRKVLRRPCGALDCPDRFKVPMHGTKVVGLPEASSVPRRRAWISRRRL
jgi:hypothetical protein